MSCPFSVLFIYFPSSFIVSYLFLAFGMATRRMQCLDKLMDNL